MSDARVIRARHWIEFVRLLKDGATVDLDAIGEDIEDATRSLAAKTQAQQIAHARSKITRAQKKLREARKQKTELRQALLLDDEDTDGVS